MICSFYIFDYSINKLRFIPFEVCSDSPFRESVFSRVIRVLTKDVILIKKLLTSNNVRIIHINTAPDLKAILRDFTFVFISKILNRKVIIQIHGSISEYKHLSCTKWFFAFVFSLSDKILTFSKSEINFLQKIVSKKKIHLFPNAVKVSDFQSLNNSFRCNLDIPQETKIVLFLSRFIKEKGV